MVTLSDIMKKITCFKNPKNPSCIDLFLTNRATVDRFKTGLPFFSEFHKMIVTVMKVHNKKQKQNV